MPRASSAPCTWGIREQLRNAVDHGIESRADRQKLGKGPPRIELRASLVAEGCVVEIADDGRGIDWQRVRERAHELGMRAESEQELLSALFADGFSTRREVSDISGRGVGLSSVLEVCNGLGIRMQADSRPLVGTTFRFTLPEGALQLKSANARQSRWRVPAAS